MNLHKTTIESTTYQRWQEQQSKALKARLKAGELSSNEYARQVDTVMKGYLGRNGKRHLKACIIWDHDVRGLGLRITPRDVKTWVLSYRVRGVKHLMKLGRYGQPLMLDTARSRAKAELGDINRGIDPLEERKKAMEAEKQQWRVKRLVEEFKKEHVAKKATKTQKHYNQILDMYVVSCWGTRRAKDITDHDVELLRDSLSKKPYQANKTLAVVSRLMSYAEKRRVRPQRSNPCCGVKRIEIADAKAERDRRLTNDELARLGKALVKLEVDGRPRMNRGGEYRDRADGEERNDRDAAEAVRLLLFTGCRLNEILKLPWDKVTLEEGVIVVDGKTGLREVVLSAPAIEVLSRIPERGPFVFPGRAPRRPRNDDLKRAWEWLEAEAEIKHRRHDLRHTVGSTGGDANLALPMITSLLGHKQTKTTEGYVEVDTEPIKKAADTVAGEIAAALNGDSGGEVVNIDSRK